VLPFSDSDEPRLPFDDLTQQRYEVIRPVAVIGNRNRSGGTNNHAAARWQAKSSVGSKEGATSSRKAASHAAVR